ncbi:MAG: WbqC family protein [Bacteroidetes bacterium]|nr:WbqC family protein [Bacteroidota bacterium]
MIVLRSTAYLPPISYIAGCLHAQEIVVERFETYPKQTLRNRCRILGPNGLQVLSIPVLKVHGNHTLTRDIRVSDTLPWQRSHWRSIETAYNNSPFFLYYKDEFENAFKQPADLLLDINAHLLQTVFSILNINMKISFTEDFLKNPEGMEDQRHFSGTEYSTAGFDGQPYTQVFSPKHDFIPDLSIIDLIFNLGPEASGYLV